MPKVKRIYVDASLEKEHVSAHETNYFREHELSVFEVEDHIVLPLKQKRIDVRGAKFSG